VTFALVAGGGTGGHVMPALAIADALVADGHDVALVGTASGMEAALVPAAGHRLETLDLAPFPRRGQRSGTLWGARARAGLKLVAGVVEAWRLLGRHRPQVVISVGGYVSVPVVLAARVRRVPVVVVSYDARPGLATRLGARFAVATAVAFPDAALPHAVHTGAPLRASLRAVDLDRDRVDARRALDLPEEAFVVLVVGGSHGSGPLNDVVLAMVAAHAEQTDVAIRHVVGRRNAQGLTGRSGDSGLLHQVVAFEDRMDLAYAAADVVVARAGASTVAEIAALGAASVLVPWPAAAEDHQMANARWLADQAAAVAVPERDLDADRLWAELTRLRVPEVRTSLRRNAAALGRRDAASAVAALAERSARPAG
jgi:UDP-N-acetylglucosamine--N-acetylmuramyl-(pentapeptide) pyrophosphoryl-undecaprenol N-acetylglucosamine transferase